MYVVFFLVTEKLKSEGGTSIGILLLNLPEMIQSHSPALISRFMVYSAYTGFIFLDSVIFQVQKARGRWGKVLWCCSCLFFLWLTLKACSSVPREASTQCQMQPWCECLSHELKSYPLCVLLPHSWRQWRLFVSERSRGRSRSWRLKYTSKTRPSKKLRKICRGTVRMSMFFFF